MNRDKQVSFMLTRNLGALTQRDIVVTRTDEHCTHTRLRINQSFNTTCNLQSHVLFARFTTETDRTRIFPTMTCIHRDHHIA